MRRGASLRTLLADMLFFNSASIFLLKSFLLNRDGATVFIYHLVCDKSYHRFLKSGDLEQLDVNLFKNQLVWLLSNGFSFLTIEELSNKILNAEDISLKCIAITFDDGFKITIDNVLPIFKSLKIKATFFITTDWIDANNLLWQQKYHWYLKNYGLKDFFDKIRQIDKESFDGLNYSQCHRKFMQDILPEHKEMLIRQYNRPIPNEKNIAADIYPSSDDVLRLNSLGMQIGSHSCGHYFMQNLSDDLYLKELLKSKEKLENLIDKSVDSFSYPFNSYREDNEIVKKTGYKTLCTVDEHKVNKSTLLNRLPRFDAPGKNILFKNSLRKLIYFIK